jgi:hypothetical protein
MKQLRTKDLFLHVLLYQEEGSIIAHCLDLDLMGDGKTASAALKRLFGVIEHHIACLIADGRLDDLYFPAPIKYWKKFSQAKPLGAFNYGPKRSKIDLPRLPIHQMAAMNLHFQEMEKAV